MLSRGLSRGLVHSPTVVAESCRIDGGHRVPPPAWPAGTLAVAAVSGHGCSASVGCYWGERKKKQSHISSFMVSPVVPTSTLPDE